jgi:succinoglycan biosynthesis protein ExoM
MSASTPAIAVCVCTFRRSSLLPGLLRALIRQQTGGLFHHFIVIADNDRGESARAVVEEAARDSRVPIIYCVEPEQNIALARNRAVAGAHGGDYIAFIDDDELPPEGWLLTLFQACRHHEIDGVLGPVTPQFETPPPDWVHKAGFYNRPSYPSGTRIQWRQGRTGNVLLRSTLFDGVSQPFDPRFGSGGEDQDFFRRMIEKGHQFLWCEEAVVPEIVPAIRWNRRFLLRRALLRGKLSLRHPTFGLKDITASALAIPAYTVALPFLLLAGQHLFMKYLVSLFDHLGRILATLGVNPIEDRYVTE